MNTVIAALITAVIMLNAPAPAAETPKALMVSEAVVPVTEAPIEHFSDVGKTDEPTMTYIGRMYVTGYDACVKCTGKTDGITASGARAQVGRTVAMCSDYPFGTEIYIDGLGTYTVEDRGVGRGCVDVFCEDHPACYAVTGWYDCYIVEEDTGNG